MRPAELYTVTGTPVPVQAAVDDDHPCKGLVPEDELAHIVNELGGVGVGAVGAGTGAVGAGTGGAVGAGTGAVGVGTGATGTGTGLGLGATGAGA